MLMRTLSGMYWHKGHCERSPVCHQEGCPIKMLW